MKAVVTWIIVSVVILGELSAVCLLPHTGIPLLVQILGGVMVFFVMVVTFTWFSLSAWMVKNAVNSAKIGNWEKARFFLISRGWAIYPARRYTEIVTLIRQLSVDPNRKPKSDEFIKYITFDGRQYGIASEGWVKMIDKIDSGLIGGGLFENPRYFRILWGAVAVIAVVRVLLLIIDSISKHH